MLIRKADCRVPGLRFEGGVFVLPVFLSGHDVVPRSLLCSLNALALT